MDEGRGQHHLLALPLRQIPAEDVPLPLHLEEPQPPVDPFPDVVQAPDAAGQLEELLRRQESRRSLHLGDDADGPPYAYGVPVRDTRRPDLSGVRFELPT